MCLYMGVFGGWVRESVGFECFFSVISRMFFVWGGHLFRKTVVSISA